MGNRVVCNQSNRECTKKIEANENKERKNEAILKETKRYETNKEEGKNETLENEIIKDKVSVEEARKTKQEEKNKENEAL